MERYGESEIVTALEESATSQVFKLRPKQTEAFVRGYDVSVSPPLRYA